MKKNKMMRIASVLLVAVLLSTSVISGTFAKYTSTYTGTATANIAQWSFAVNDVAVTNTFTFNLFNSITDTYDDGAEQYVEVTNVDDGMIAPGTKGSFAIKLTNTSDVVATYNVALSDTAATPIEFAVEYPVGEHKLAIGDSATVTVTWEWPYDGGDDDADVAFAADNATYEVIATVTVTQVD